MTAGDIKVAGKRLMDAVNILARLVNSIAENPLRLLQSRQILAGDRTDYLRALEEFGTALGYPVYDPGALSYNRKESDSPIYFD